MPIFIAKTTFVGSHLPEEGECFDGGVFTNEKIEDSGWETIIPEVGTAPSPGGNMVRSAKNVSFDSGATIYIKVSTATPSAKEAFDLARQEASHLCSLLSVTNLGGRYFFEVTAIKLAPGEKIAHIMESPPSKEVYAISYQKEKLLDEQRQHVFQAYEACATDETLRLLYGYLAKGLNAELDGMGVDEKAIIFYYKVLELIGNKIAREQNSEEKKLPMYEAMITELEEKLPKAGAAAEKLTLVREASAKLREIDRSVIGKNIIEAGRTLGFDDQNLTRIGNLIDDRNKRIIHPSSGAKEQGVKDTREYREAAKMYLRFYLRHTHGISPEFIDRSAGIKEIGGIYRVTYFRSG